jgi:phosphotransferase system  glucose/maltose/N-acetylglucosamine-specific IIC component
VRPLHWCDFGGIIFSLLIYVSMNRFLKFLVSPQGLQFVYLIVCLLMSLSVLFVALAVLLSQYNLVR